MSGAHRKWPSVTERIKTKTIQVEDCIIFTGASAGKGYGVISYKGQINYVHRIVWEQHNGEITDGLFVLHKCDNPACCNIDHLFLGTAKDNYHDMVDKGRRVLHTLKP